MNQVAIEKTDLTTLVRQARKGHVVVMRRGKPVALIVGVAGMDREQLELGSSDKFWKLIERRRKQGRMDRKGLEKKLAAKR
jgi:prevent-host-death family protein